MNSHEFLKMMLAKKLTRKALERVKEHIRQNKCIGVLEDEQGNEIDCQEPVHHRGLCKKCYSRWYNARRNMTEAEQVQYDTGLINDGRLLGQNGKREYERKDAYRRYAESIRRRA